MPKKKRQRGTCPTCGRENLAVLRGSGPYADGRGNVATHKRGAEWCRGGLAIERGEVMQSRHRWRNKKELLVARTWVVVKAGRIVKVSLDRDDCEVYAHSPRQGGKPNDGAAVYCAEVQVEVPV